MRTVTREEIPQEAQVMTELWNMIKDFYVHEPTDEYWDALLERSRDVDRKCNHSRLGQKLILAFQDYIEEQQKKEVIPHGA